MLVTNELLKQVWEALEELNEKTLEAMDATGRSFEAYIEGNTTFLQIKFMDCSLWSSEENDTTKASDIFQDALQELSSILTSVKTVEV